MATTELTRHVRAPREAVYHALLDPDSVASWKVPNGMTSRVHAFEPEEGGFFRVSLTYVGGGAGKTTERTDTYHGRFVKLVPNELVVAQIEFETTNPNLRGIMTETLFLQDEGAGTRVSLTHKDVPAGISPADNEVGCRMALDKLAALLEVKPPA
jgi:uncharacterized protein YndB with AHSA1/START domain